MKINKQHGFTIVELVVVILVIGILSAVALPKLFDLTTQARKSTVATVTSSFKTGVELVYSQWLVNSNPDTINLGSTNFWIGSSQGSSGYPQNVGSSLTGTLTSTVCKDLWDNLLNNPPVAATTELSPGCAASGACKFEVKVDNGLCVFFDKDNNTITYDRSTGAVISSVIF